MEYFFCPALNQETHAKRYSYILTTPSSINAIPTGMTIADLKAQLRLDPSDTSEDALLTMYLQSATQAAELYTRRELVSRSWTTYRDSLDEVIELRKSPTTALTSISYRNTGGTFTAIAGGTYQLTQDTVYPCLELVTQTYAGPTDMNTDLVQGIKVIFVAGYDATYIMPVSLKIAIYGHAASIYTNRGDCGSDDCSSLSSSILSVYDKYRIINITGRRRFY